jgi:ABC-type transport system substrate-binding protein
MKIPILATIAILATLTIIPFTAQRANAVAGLDIKDPLNTWTTFGPDATVNHVLLKYYGDDRAEFLDFQTGGLDIADTGTAGTGPPASTWPTYDANPDWNMSGVQGSGSWQGIYFNGASSTWLHWGCDWQFYNSACGIEMRQAFAHLMDRPAFDAIHLVGGGGQAIWDDIPANKVLATSLGGGPMSSPASNFCKWDTISNAGCSSTTGPYKLANNPSGNAIPGSPDFCLAADHMIKAGIATGKAAGTCVLTGINAGVLDGTHPIRAKVRSSEPRRSIGTGFVNALNQLFGSTVTSVQFGNINTIGHAIVFSEIVSPVDDWDFYTYGYQDTGPFPTYLYTQFHTKFTFSPGFCAGGQSVANEPTNPMFVCIPQLDLDVKKAVQTNSEVLFDQLIITNTDSAANLAGIDVATFPFHTFNVRTPALRSATGLTIERGVGYQGVQLELGAKKGTYVPTDSRFLFNGGGSADTFRWGQAQGIDFVNLFQAGSVWEANTYGSVYDTLFSANPESTNQVFCNMCQTIIPSVVAGNQQYQVTLRQNLRWQNGVPVDAFDVKFSYLNIRDFASNLSGGLGLLLDVTVLSPNTLIIKMDGQSVGHLPNLSGIPIMPRQLWEKTGDKTYGDVGVADPAKVDPSYDPIAAGTFIGSAQLACVSVFPEDLGKVGTGCARNPDGSRAGQSIAGGGTMLLTRYDFTTKSGTTDPFAQWFRNNNPAWGTGSNAVAAQSGGYQEFLWADRFNNGTVTITDVNDVANCVGHSSNGGGCTDYAYFLRNSVHPGTPGVISNELAIVASHYGDEWLNPYTFGAHPPADATAGSMTNVVPHP